LEVKLPPLKALHYFSVAAYQPSFNEAAKLLHVSEGAVSRQMKLLSDYHGKALFEKRGRTMELTEAGRILAASAHAAFDSISQVSNQLLADQTALTINVTTSFAIRWLLPKLGHFERLYPDYRLQMQATSSESALLGKSFDVKISYYLTGQEPANFKEHKLQDEWLMAVCAPNYLKNNTVFSIGELVDCRLLLNEMTGRDWRLWGELLSQVDLPIERALKFEQDDVAIQAAVAGHGIALANVAYIQSELSLGSLVAATDQAPIVTGAHYLSIAKERQNALAVQAFTNWLKSVVTDSDVESCFVIERKE
jgi:LysR family glycine cleavage system transcriptional activator